MGDEKDKEKLEALRARKEAALKRIHQAEEDKDLVTQERETAQLELRAKYLDQGLHEGEDFAVVDCGAAGNVVLKLPDHGRMVLFKRFRAQIDDPKNGKITLENCQQFVTPCVVEPDRAEFLAACERHPGLIFDLANFLHAMLGRNEALERGK